MRMMACRSNRTWDEVIECVAYIQIGRGRTIVISTKNHLPVERV